MVQVIVPGKPAKLALRLVAYTPNGPRLGVLPQHLGFEVAAPLNDVPGLKVTYPAGGLNAAFLAGHCEIAVEYSVEGGSWAEPPNARFLRIRRGGDSTDLAGSRSYDCPAWSWMLRKVLLYPNGSMVEGKRPFNAVSPGAILATFIQEGQARGTLLGLSYGFSASHDSAGAPWSSSLTLALEPGRDLLTVLINLAEQGVLDWRMQGRTLEIYNPDTVMGADLASGSSPVDLRLGRDIGEAPDTGTIEDAASAILIGGEAGLSVEVTNPAAVAPWGRWESYQSQGGVKDQGTAQLLGQNALERVGSERIQITRSLLFQAARWLPFEHYQPGDYLLAPGDGGAMQSLRLRQITLSIDKDGQPGGNVVLNDRFLEREIRLARQAAGILDGGVSSGGSGGDPAPEANNRIPAAPPGLIADPVAYLDENGFARGLVTATWGAVAADVAGVALSIDGYELFARINQAGALWMQVAVTDETTAAISPLVVGTTYAFKVRATAAGVKGEFSAQAVVAVPDDATPPPVPTAPQLTTRLGVIHVAWDGLGVGGVPMPSDFALLRVWMQDPLAPGAAVVGHLDAAGSLVIPGQPYGADREIWLTSIDRSGNESVASTSAVIATAALVDTDVIGEVINGAAHIISGSIPADAKIVAGSITGSLIQALAIQAGHIQVNAIEADKIAVGAIEAGHLAANAVTAGSIAANAITSAKIAADAITGKTITGSVVRSAATGQRFILDSATLDLRFYPANGTNYSRLYALDGLYPGEVTTFITSGTNQSGTARAELQVAAGLIRLRIRDSSGSGDNGGGLDIAQSYGQYGYTEGIASTETYIHTNGTGRFYLRGRVWDMAAVESYDAVNAGSVTIPSGNSGATYTYGTTMASNMGPVSTVRDGASNANFYWCLDASSQTGFSLEWSQGGGVYSGKAIYWWAHRH